MNIYSGRIKELRKAMKQEGISYYMIPTADFHQSEYSADYFKEREFFSGFDGSNGTLVVGHDWAGLWTDGRYWIQATQQIKGSGIQLMKMMEPGVPDIPTWLFENMDDGEVFGFDGRCVSRREGAGLAELLAGRNITIKCNEDLGDPIWKDRPLLPCHPMFELSDEQAGESFAEKVGRLRDVMRDNGASYYVCAKLDDLMWLTNLRGNDVECNPVALSYGFFSMDKQIIFVQNDEVTEEIRKTCDKHKIEIMPYGDFDRFLKEFNYMGNVMYDPESVSYGLYLTIKAGIRNCEHLSCHTSPVKLIQAESPITIMKAVKNPVEIRNIRDIYKEDSAAVCRFIYWLTHEADISNITEYDAAVKMDSLRKEIHDFIELSFGTITATGPNAAMMHYEPSADHSSKLKREGMLLMDCGGTYYRGTTDMTRTMALGKVTDEMKKSYTLTAAGNLGLLNASFMKGCTGRNLDILAREPLWAVGSDYKCGTGHGIGYVLNVHEGPQNIRWRFSKGADAVEFLPGMIVSDEPGVYKEGKFGIRIETILICVPKCKTTDGEFLCFDPLTFVPLDKELIDPQYLSDREMAELNEYHRQCREEMLPYFESDKDRDIKQWLIDATEAISK